MTAKLKGFGRRPFAGDAGTGRGAGVRKPRKEETAGRKRRGLAGRDLWRFWGRGRIAQVAAGWRAAFVVISGEHDALFRGRGCERRVWAQRLERVCGGREDVVFVLRRARGGEGDKHSEAGNATMIMRCRS
jgi:hypothetical protein